MLFFIIEMMMNKWNQQQQQQQNRNIWKEKFNLLLATNANVMFLSHHQNNSEIHICKCGSRTQKTSKWFLFFVFSSLSTPFHPLILWKSKSKKNLGQKSQFNWCVLMWSTKKNQESRIGKFDFSIKILFRFCGYSKKRKRKHYWHSYLWGTN